MPDVEIRETIVTQDVSGAVVQLQISDVPLPAEHAAIRITLSIQVPEYERPLLAHLQIETLKIVLDCLGGIHDQLAQEIRATGLDLIPRKKGQPIRG